jgi:cytoskeletal protein CcmA (bactofilin family)
MEDEVMENSNFELVKENIGKNQLFVGPGLKVKVEVSECDTLRLEGDVAGIVKAKRLSMSESGKFQGAAEVESAEVDGSFEGTLTVSGLLRVGKTGRVFGKLRYAEIEIERNGRISGDISTVEAGLASSHSNKSDEAGLASSPSHMPDLDSDATSINQVPDPIAEALRITQHRLISDHAQKQSWSEVEAATEEVKARKGFFGLVMGQSHHE